MQHDFIRPSLHSSHYASDFSRISLPRTLPAQSTNVLIFPARKHVPGLCVAKPRKGTDGPL